MKKGVVASPVDFKYHMVGLGLNSALTEEMLRYYLLYWDEIVIPDNNLISVGGDLLAQVEHLDNVYRPFIRHSGRYHDHAIADAILCGQFEMAELLHKDPSVDWVIHQSNMERLVSPNTGVVEQNALKIRLSDILPVPSKSTPFVDLIQFRERRLDEFKQLHVLLDDLYLQVLSSPDQPLSEKRAISELTDLINDLDSLTKERFGFINKVSIEPSYDFKVKDVLKAPLWTNAFDSFQTFLATGGVSDTSPFSATVIGLAIGVLSNIGVKLAPTKKPTGIDSKARLSYLSLAAKEGFIGL